MDRILEIGCGFGRITRLLAEHFPAANITALDLSLEQLANAKAYCGENPNLRFLQHDFYSGLPFPGTGYHSVIAVEVFLHHPAEVVLSLLEKLAAISQHIINIDWSEPWSRPTSPHVWVHDYASLYAKRGLQCVTLCLPEKIEGKQQKLFIAAHQLSQTLLKLEAQGLAAPPPAAEPATDWMGQVCQATEDLLSRTQPGSTIILVNDDQWGNEHAIADRRILPFLEKGGVYAGPPSDDLQASQELDRMLQGGAGYIVFAWNSFWWLDHYAAFHHQLRQRFHCVLNNECLVIFELKTPNPNNPSIQ